jgi:hypothetical protein
MLSHNSCVTAAQVVGKPTADGPKEKFVQDMVAIISRVCQAEVQQEDIAVKVGRTDDMALVCVLALLLACMLEVLKPQVAGTCVHTRRSLILHSDIHCHEASSPLQRCCAASTLPRRGADA